MLLITSAISYALMLVALGGLRFAPGFLWFVVWWLRVLFVAFLSLLVGSLRMGVCVCVNSVHTRMDPTYIQTPSPP